MSREPIVFNRLEDSNCFPVVGPSWTVGAGTTFPTGYFGNGILGTSAGHGAYAYVENILPNNDAGTLECWWDKKTTPSGYFAMLGDVGLTNRFEVEYGIVGSELWLVILKRTSPPDYIRYKVAYSTISDGWHHIACCWDRSGIGGGANTCRAYIDGVQVGSSNTVIAAETFPSNYPITAGAIYQSGLLAPSNGACDNIKLYDYAKTDFSDRFYDRGGMNDLLIMN